MLPSPPSIPFDAVEGEIEQRILRHELLQAAVGPCACTFLNALPGVPCTVVSHAIPSDFARSVISSQSSVPSFVEVGRGSPAR